MMLTIIAKSDNYIVLKKMTKYEKWSLYMQDFDQNSFPYQFSDSPKELLEKHLLENRFDIHHIDIEMKSFKFTKLDFNSEKLFTFYLIIKHFFWLSICIFRKLRT